MKKQPEDGIMLTVDLRRQIADRRIKQGVEPRPGRFTHNVVIRRAEDPDDTVRDWIREEYDEHR